MFTRDDTYSRDENADVSVFIKDYDLDNSEFLYWLNNYEGEVKEYLVTKYEGRMDLISRDIYGSDLYEWILIFFNKIEDNYSIKRGYKIKYIPIEELKKLISKI